MTAKRKLHWIAQSGMHGYLAESSYVCRTKAAAISSLLDIHDLPPHGRMAKDLRKYESADFDSNEYDLWYLSVCSCDCDEPWIHDEDTTQEDWEMDN